MGAAGDRGTAMKSITAIAALALAAFAADDASAQGKGKIYKCRNEKGEVFYSQSYDPKQCGGGGAQLNDAGVEVRAIERRKSSEELAAERAEAERVAEANRLAAELKRQDDVLMQSYPTEAELIRAHQQEVEAIDGVIRTQEMSAAGYESILSELLASAAEAERAGKPVAPALAKRIDGVRADIDTQRQAIRRKRDERAASDAEHALRLARYREIKARQQKQLEGR